MRHIKHLVLSSIFLFLMPIVIMAQDLEITYKTIDTSHLAMDIYYPPDYKTGSSYPAMVFFFGGGWKGGSVKQFEPHANYFSKRGLVCFLVDYRVSSRQGTTPFESLKDAKSAIRFIRRNASQYHVNPDKIIASGGSAGGHLAAATALAKGFNEYGEDISISCIPNSLVLYNPVIDNGPGGYGYERVGDDYKDFSPLHNIRKNAPPTIFFLGTEDNLIPVATAQYYKTTMERVGSRCELFLYKDQGHGFFNFRNSENYHDTVLKTDEFLRSLGYLQGEPTLSR